jgi:hypothetical protein
VLAPACSSSKGGGTDSAAGSGGTGGTGGATGGSGGSGGTGGSGGNGGTGGSGGKLDAGGGGKLDGGGTGAKLDGGAKSDAAPSKADANPGSAADGGGGTASPMMSFFVTSVPAGMGGNLGGLDGADAKCKELATAVGVGNKTWHAYLSTSTVNARTRIGNGPWRNVKGVVIANDVATLHDQQGMAGALNATWPVGAAAYSLILDEKGNQVSSNPLRHDILTGSTMAGMVDGTNTCNNWTSTTGMATNGHSNRDGGGRPPSWNSAHTVGCGPFTGNQDFVAGTVTSGGGGGAIYCFAID